MKKLLYLLLCTASTLLITPLEARNQLPLALTTPFILSLVSGNTTAMESVLDGLNFDHAREIACTLNSNPNESAPVEISYQLRWGYKGAGEATEPFKGIQGILNIQFNYDGLSFQLCKSRSLKSTMQSILKPLITITPCQEFYLKIAQLAWTVCQEKNPDIDAISQSLITLVQRLKKTEGGASCMLYTMPILNNGEHLGLESFLDQAPQLCASHFITLSQKIGAFWSLLTGAESRADRTAYLRAILEQIEYYNTEDLKIIFPNGGWLTIPSTDGGSGNPDSPFTSLALSLFMPASEHVTHATEWRVTLAPDHVCFLKGLMLILYNRKNPLPPHQLAEEISTICSRFSNTPLTPGKKSSYLRTLLGAICAYHQMVLHYSFQKPIDHILSHEEFMLQLCRIGYHAYIMPSAYPTSTLQERVDFITLHTADALRCYQGVIALRAGCSDLTRIPALENNGAMIKWDLFSKTLFGPLPEE
ncbi:MAG: hypothetical protein WCJ17_02525 [bacterium]